MPFGCELLERGEPCGLSHTERMAGSRHDNRVPTPPFKIQVATAGPKARSIEREKTCRRLGVGSYWRDAACVRTVRVTLSMD